MFAKLEQNNFKWIRHNQGTIRSERYQGLKVALSMGDSTGITVGRTIVLPSTVTCSPRQMQQINQGSMAIVRKFGKPDLFITMTCNPRWQEITDLLLPGQQAHDRPDVVARVFNAKLKALMVDLLEKNVFGKVAAKIHVIEFQKRGLPHAHLLLILESNSNPRGPEDYDRFVSAEVPNYQHIPILYGLVKKHHLHGPCTSRCKDVRLEQILT
jgi:hypothetical protein